MTVTSTQATQTTQSARQATAGSTTSAGSLISADFTMFLKMLTAQMQNQDPLNPIESSDYTVQLATFSGVEQQVRTNDLLQGLAQQMGAGGIAGYAGWIGMEAQVTEPVAFTGSPVTLAPRLRDGADQGRLVVLDAGGAEVAAFDLPAGSDQVVWDGTDGAGTALPAGVYSFRVDSLAQGQSLGSDPVPAYGRISEVRLDGSEARVILEGGAAVAASAVTALRAGSTG